MDGSIAWSGPGGLEMDITFERQGGAVVATVAGSIDTLTSGSLSESLAEQIETGGARQLVLDMSGVDYISSAGLRSLLGAVKLARQQGGDFRLAEVRELVLKVLTLSGFTSILRLYDDVGQAVASFCQEPAGEER
jgi:anti-anti-sigma factor